MKDVFRRLVMSAGAITEFNLVNLLKRLVLGERFKSTAPPIYNVLSLFELIKTSDCINVGFQVMTSVRLKIHSNSVRRAKWYAKMGFMRYPGPMSISLDSVLPDGGTVGLMNAVIARVYPMLYMSKDLSGKTGIIFKIKYLVFSIY